MTATPFPTRLRFRPAARLGIGLGLALALALAVIGPDRILAQIEGDRGIAPIAATTDIQIGGIEVETTGKDAQEARLNGWKLAQRKAWEALKGPQMSDGQIDAMVSAIVVEREQIGPKRYIARLGVIFDRSRAGQFLATTADGLPQQRSAPLLVVPVLYSGGTAQVFEVQGDWQRAWAYFRTGASPIDYVRPSGAGGESLLLTAGQTTRRSRLWWRNVLDQFSAADVIMPLARLERQWPGGPVRGTFTARYGPDNAYLDSFTLTSNGSDRKAIREMMNRALVRIDGIYVSALAQGLLRPDPTLVTDQYAIDAVLAQVAALAQAGVEAETPADGPAATPNGGAAPRSSPTASPSAPVQASSTFAVQFASPDARAVDAALAAVRGAPGVQGAATSSIAIGGTSVMRVTTSTDLDTLAAALRAAGWQVTVGSNALSIRR